MAEPAPSAKRPRLSSETSVAWAPPETTFTWKLENLTAESFTGAAPSDVWRSDEFDGCGLRWRLLLSPRFEHKDGLCCRLVLELVSAYSGADRELFAEDSKVVLASARGQKAQFSLRAFPLRAYTAGMEQPQKAGTISHVIVLDQTAWLLVNGVMTVRATLRALSFAQLKPVEPRPPMMNAGLGAVLSGGDLADVTFRAPDGEDLPAHATILGLRSTTLRALLLGPMAQALPSVRSPPVHAIPGGMDAATFRSVLRFLYTDDEPDSDVAGMRTLLAAADYLDVPRLREVCLACLHAALAPDNAVATLAVATTLACASLLRDAALRYIAANVQAVMSADWSSLSPELTADVLHTLATGEPPYMARGAT
jgi:hypothetical protein